MAYQCVLAYLVALWIYQFGTFATTGIFSIGTAAAVVTLLLALYLVFIKKPYSPKEEAVKFVERAKA